MLHTILCHGAFTVGLCLYFLNSPRVAACFRPSDGGIVLLTAFFALFIFSSVFNCFGARTDRLRLLAGIRKNPVFLAIMVAVLAIQILFVYLGGSVLRTVPLTASELLVTGALSLAVIPAELCRKILWRLTKGKGGY
jgi:magnesium-transporting ATPase (P-type)